MGGGAEEVEASFKYICTGLCNKLIGKTHNSYMCALLILLNAGYGEMCFIYELLCVDK